MAKAKAGIGRGLSLRKRNGASRASAAGVRGARISDLATMIERPRMAGSNGSARGLDDWALVGPAGMLQTTV